MSVHVRMEHVQALAKLCGGNRVYFELQLRQISFFGAVLAHANSSMCTWHATPDPARLQ